MGRGVAWHHSIVITKLAKAQDAIWRNIPPIFDVGEIRGGKINLGDCQSDFARDLCAHVTQHVCRPFQLVAV